MFEGLRSQQRAALISYITAGDPQPAATVELMRLMVEAGADAVELGVPFSDPMADGPVIQRASERALTHGVSIGDVLAMVAKFREHQPDVPVILMGYLNPVEVMGYENFANRAADSGVDGVITVDMPPEEAVDLSGALTTQGIDSIYLLAPTTDPDRVRMICERASGFVYYVSLRGVTGAGHIDVAEVEEHVRDIKTQCNLPVGVGFGIDNPQVAADMARFADAVIVGSAVVRRIEQADGDIEQIHQSLSAFIASLREAIGKHPQPWAATP
jgi:tryptophan synthase alpha chain